MPFLAAHFRDPSGQPLELHLVEIGDGTYSIATSDLGGPTGQLGYQQITALSNAVKVAVPAKTVQVTMTIEGAPIRYRLDGVNPTASVGMPVAVGQTITFNGEELANLTIIGQAAGAIANLLFEG